MLRSSWCLAVRRLGHARSAAGMTAALIAGSTLASAAPSDAPMTRVLHNMGDLWGLTDSEKERAYRVKMDLTVFYYDPAWRVFWVDDGVRGSFLPTAAGKELPIKAGDRIHLDGVLHPNKGLDANAVQLQVLEHDALPTPVSVAEDLDDDARWNMRWVTVEGIPIRQDLPDDGHVKVEILSEGRIVLANVLRSTSDAIPMWEGHRIRVAGVYVGSRDSTGSLEGIALWVPNLRNIVSLGMATDDIHLRLPTTSINQLASVSGNAWVHISGFVTARDQGHSLTVRDATGQLTIPSQQPDWLNIGQRVDVVGRVRGTGVLANLTGTYFRVLSDADQGVARPLELGREPALLEVADQVMGLPAQQAATGIPVKLRGVVTWSSDLSKVFFLQDPSGGVMVRRKLSERPPAVGHMVQVEGTSVSGVVSPEVQASKLSDLGVTPLPTPENVGLDQAISGSEQAKAVTISGYLSKITEDGKWSHLEFTAPTGTFMACAPLDGSFQNALGSFVRVTGVCTTLPEADTVTRLPLVLLRLWDASQVQVTQRSPADLYSIPSVTLPSLRQYLAFHNINDLCRVPGAVIDVQPDGSFYLQDGGAGILVRSRASEAPAAGTNVDVVGVPGREGGRLVLREAVWRAAPVRTLPEATFLDSAVRIDRGFDGTLVTLRATLEQAARVGDGWNLECRNRRAFTVHLGNVSGDHLPALGSKLSLVGVYVLEYDEFREPRAFTLRLRGLPDIQVLEAPSWWTTRHAMAIAAGLGICTLLGVAWVLALRRRVSRQTAQIRTQLESEARLRAELERAGRLESLGVLAGGIAHDFNNLLTVVLSNLGLAKMDETLTRLTRESIDDATRGATRAAEITQQLLTFAKGGDPVRTAVSLPEVVRESAEFGRHGSNVRCEYKVSPELWQANIDRAQFGRVIHNLVLNATQAMPQGGIIRIELSNAVDASSIRTLAPGAYVKVVIGDNGPGIAADHLARIFEPYFSTKDSNHGLGLAAVHSIVKKHRGHISVQSEPGQGTTFQIWLPAVETAVPAAPAQPTVPEARQRPLRVLFMDDENQIRQTAKVLLDRLGHTAMMAADGSEAVKIYREGLASGHPPEVVILDLTVPGGMGGRAAMEELRHMDPDVRAIVSSGYSSDPVMANHSAYGFKAVVAKPYDVKLLARTIQDVARPTRSAPPASILAN